jgi:peptidoglycan/LPS O-acetylase OafA/YrhL
MLKSVALVSFGALLLLSGWLMVSSISANQHLPWSWRPDDLTYTFVFMVVFMLSVLLVQAVRPFSWVVVAQVVIVGVLLLIASLLHAYPKWSMVFGVLHLTCAAGFTVWNVITLLGRQPTP